MELREFVRTVPHGTDSGRRGGASPGGDRRLSPPRDGNTAPPPRTKSRPRSGAALQLRHRLLRGPRFGLRLPLGVSPSPQGTWFRTSLRTAKDNDESMWTRGRGESDLPCIPPPTFPRPHLSERRGKTPLGMAASASAGERRGFAPRIPRAKAVGLAGRSIQCEHCSDRTTEGQSSRRATHRPPRRISKSFIINNLQSSPETAPGSAPPPAPNYQQTSQANRRTTK